MPLVKSKLSQFDALDHDLMPLRMKLLNHPVYERINTIPRLRIFMQIHVFAVWDFMSLIKRLQREMTCEDVPWCPPESPELARFVNEVILCEESDLGPDGKPRSHLEMYLEAMEEVGASTRTFRSFLARYRETRDVPRALADVRAPAYIQSFVLETLTCARSGSKTSVAAAFLFGREDLIPQMFERILPLWEGGSDEVSAFAHYLRRHIEVDGEEHGPIARAALTRVAGEDFRNWRDASRSAKAALRQRIRLWDGVCSSIEHASV